MVWLSWSCRAERGEEVAGGRACQDVEEQGELAGRVTQCRVHSEVSGCGNE